MITLRRLVDTLKRHRTMILNMVGRGVIQSVNDAGNEHTSQQLLDLKGHAGEKLPVVPNLGMFGFGSVPVPGCAVTYVCAKGARESAMAVGVDDPNRPKDFLPGDSYQYHPDGMRMTLTKDGWLYDANDKPITFKSGAATLTLDNGAISLTGITIDLNGAVINLTGVPVTINTVPQVGA